MLIYRYNADTKEYAGSESAYLDPLETEKQEKEVYLIPANATTRAPELAEGCAAVWNGSEWESVEDNRGKEYWLDTDTYGTAARVMTELGAYPDGAVFTAPEMSDEEKKAAALKELNTQYAADKQELSAQYLDAAMSGDTDTMDAIKQELAALNEKYDADYAELNK